MSQRLLLCPMVFLFGCTAGPTGPYEYWAPSVAVHVRFADVPAGAAVYAGLDAEFLTNSNDDQQLAALTPPAMLGGSLVYSEGASASATLNAGEARFELVSYSAGTNHGDVRLFWVRASLSSDDSNELWAQPGLILAYTPWQTTWHLFGPASPAVTLPQGYSWLRRSCSAVPGQIQMEVVPVETVVDFRHVEGVTPGIQVHVSVDGVTTGVGEGERAEQAFLASCGASTTSADLGTRIAYERAQSLVWAPDNSRLYYFSLANENDPTASVSLRELHIADHVATELAVVPHGSSPQIDSAGTLYLSNSEQLLRVSLVPGSPATFVPLPLPATASVSPDGRWARYSDATNATHIWDLLSGAEVGTVTAAVLGWSPDSQLMSWSFITSTTAALNVQSPTTLAAVPVSYAYPGPYSPSSVSVAWDTGPYVAIRPYDWPEELAAGGGAFGLSLLDLTTGASRNAVDPSAGYISFVPTAPVRGFVFVTATNCVGLLRTSCSTSLLRVNLADATAQTIVSPFSHLSLRVSTDGHHVALGAEDGIYVKDLP